MSDAIYFFVNLHESLLYFFNLEQRDPSTTTTAKSIVIESLYNDLLIHDKWKNACQTFRDTNPHIYIPLEKEVKVVFDDGSERHISKFLLPISAAKEFIENEVTDEDIRNAIRNALQCANEFLDSVSSVSAVST